MTETSFIPGPDTAREFRDALGCFGTGVTVVTAMTQRGPAAITANSFTSVSLEPPLVLWCLANDSTRYDAFARADSYAIHVMAEDQLDMAIGFARDGLDFSEADWAPGPDGTPILTRSLARFDCRATARHEAGDHLIIVGQVHGAMLCPGKGLMFKRGQFGDFAPRV